MSKFKVGDVVERVDSQNGLEGAKVGQVAVVKVVEPCGFLHVEYDGCDSSYNAYGYEGWSHEYAKLHNSFFTPEQLEFLSSHFNISVEDIEKEHKKTIRVSDGWVESDDGVWWKHERGPEKVVVQEHLDNIKEFPDVYSIKEPEYVMVAQYV